MDARHRLCTKSGTRWLAPLLVLLTLSFLPLHLTSTPRFQGSHAPRTLGEYSLLARSWDAALPTEAPSPDTVWHTLTLRGERRSFLLSLPPHSTALPLVIAFHGLGQHAASFATQTGLVAATRAAHEALVLPESSGPAFNDSRLGPAGPADDAFTLALISFLAARGDVDPARVTLTGFSNGAGMAMEVAALHPREIAALVSVDGDLVDSPSAPRPTGPVRTVLIHGTADPVQPWRGRPSAGIMWPAYVPVPVCAEIWASAAHLPPPTHATLPPRGVGSVLVTSWASPTYPMAFYAISGMGHLWPTTSPSPGPHSPGTALAPVSATALVVETASLASL